ncbi:sugar kinase [Bradyrhizobium sp. CCGUVB1N3]|uniref:sugar kinase n=1 Tax=Bradyrhizobium sp. CCGUVB1N3 TaxID=2949629 RepID=UPI0020B1A3FA|nr:sugar kinase [Bradyrhizobium sp. CCGUVB1N3]MCP3470745.1 sugar kinase [Bradyrhizobium sp. CCGUVB1N3]
MPAGNDRKIVLVTRKTRLEDLVARYLTAAQARFYVEHLGADFSDYEREHEVYRAQQHLALQVLEQWGRYQVIERSFLPNFIFAPSDIVVALGQDGVVANTMKYLDGHPLIGLNPDPARHDGILLPFAPRDLAKLLPEVATEKRDSQAVTMAEARLSDGQVLHAVNDLFVGARTHTSAIYEIATGETKERQSSSGLIVSTGLGSTAWFKSIVTGSLAIAGRFGQPSEPAAYDALPWDAQELRFAVREPFPSRNSQVGLVCGRLASSEQLHIRSLMPENGVIFSDGIEADRLEFNAGAEVAIGIAARRGRLIV